MRGLIRESKLNIVNNKRSKVRGFFKSPLAVLGMAVILILIFCAIFADIIAPYSYSKQNLDNSFSSPSAAHWFGTDEFGRDIFSRVVYGARTSLFAGIIAIAFAVFMGGALGAAAGYYGGWLDDIIMRPMDVLLSIPSIVLAISIAAVLGPGLFNLMIAVGVSAMPAYARVMRGSVLSVREREYIEAAVAIGAPDLFIILKHVIPNCMTPIIVQSTLGVADAILAAAGLSFIGLGIQPPFPEWGAMLSGARTHIRDHSYMMIFPGLTIMLTVMSLNFLGEALRDALDPKQKR